MTAVRVHLPTHLRQLAGVRGEVRVRVTGPVTITSVMDAVEVRHPVLRGTIRDQGSTERRAFIRFFACGTDLSHQPPDAPLPDAVERGEEPLRVVGAIAGG